MKWSLLEKLIKAIVIPHANKLFYVQINETSFLTEGTKCLKLIVDECNVKKIINDEVKCQYSYSWNVQNIFISKINLLQLPLS